MDPSKRKVCPLMSPEASTVYCEEEGCAIFDTRERICSILAIPRALDELSENIRGFVEAYARYQGIPIMKKKYCQGEGIE